MLKKSIINMNLRIEFEEIKESEVVWKIYQIEKNGKESTYRTGESESLFDAKTEVSNELMSFL